MEPKKLLFKNRQAPGDSIVMSAAIRDLALQFPGKYLIGVDTTAPDVWLNNPYVSKFNFTESEVHTLGYSSAIRQSNQRKAHFLSGFHQNISEILGVRLHVTKMRPDIHLTEIEKDPASRKIKDPYIIINAGGKADMPTKMWSLARWQKVVDTLKSEMRIVQVGKIPLSVNGKRVATHYHSPLKGVVNLINQTSLRELLCLCAHSQAVVSGVTAVMHAAAAFNKPAVVIDGGREPWWWEAYNQATWEINAKDPFPQDFAEHRYLTTMNMLPCCQNIGCWKSGLGDKGKGKDCPKLVKEEGQTLPTCMTMIDPELVVDQIRKALRGEKPNTLQLPFRLKVPLFEEPIELQMPAKKTAEEARKEEQMRARKVPARQAVKRPSPVGVTSAKPAVFLPVANGRTARVNTLVKTQPMHPTVKTHPSLTICVLTYGNFSDIAARCINSILPQIQNSGVELRVGLNAVSEKTKNFVYGSVLKRYPVKIIESQENIFKYPMMRRMFWENSLLTDWTVWFDDDSHVVAHDWYANLAALLTSNRNVDVFGRPFFYVYKNDQEEWSRKASWYKGRPFKTRISKDGAIMNKIDFVTGGYWGARTGLLQAIDWPDPRIRNNGGDVFFGEACNQLSATLKKYDYGVKISDHSRRGVTHPFPSKGS